MGGPSHARWLGLQGLLVSSHTVLEAERDGPLSRVGTGPACKHGSSKRLPDNPPYNSAERKDTGGPKRACHSAPWHAAKCTPHPLTCLYYPVTSAKTLKQNNPFLLICFLQAGDEPEHGQLVHISLIPKDEQSSRDTGMSPRPHPLKRNTHGDRKLGYNHWRSPTRIALTLFQRALRINSGQRASFPPAFEDPSDNHTGAPAHARAFGPTVHQPPRNDLAVLITKETGTWGAVEPESRKGNRQTVDLSYFLYRRGRRASGQ